MVEKIAYVAGTFDTKKEELLFVRNLLKNQGLSVRTIDLGTSKKNNNTCADISAEQVARHHPNGTSAVFTGDRGTSVSAMATAFKVFLCAQTDVKGIIGFGGSGGTALISPAFQALPIGIPKVIVSTMTSGNIAPYIGTSDICMIYSITDFSGLNPILEQVLLNASNALSGMIKYHYTPDQSTVPVVGMTMFGVTTTCVEGIKTLLEPENKCLVFHATGTGGKTLEKLVDNDLLTGVLDITTTEVADHLMGGILSAGEQRLDIFARSRIPYLGSCGAIDMVNFGAYSTIPKKYEQRLFYKHNPQITLMRTTVDENIKIGNWIGKKLNKFKSDARFLIPMHGFSALDAKGEVFYDNNADMAFINALENTVSNPHVSIVKIPCHINDKAFSTACAEQYNELSRDIKK